MLLACLLPAGNVFQIVHIVNRYVNILILLVRWGLPWARNTSREVVVALALSMESQVQQFWLKSGCYK